MVPAAAPLIAERQFGAASLADLRRLVLSLGEQAGLRRMRADDLALIVYELATNAVRHGGGAGRLRAWLGLRAVYCQVADFGAGFTSQTAFGVRPSALSDHGRGLWLVESLADRLIVANGHDASPTGAAVTILVRR